MFKSYIENEQFNLQINRFINDYFEEDPRVNEDFKKILPKLTDTESWYHSWLEQAEKREMQQDFELAATYYQAAEFYLDADDPRSKKVYEKYRELFYKTYTDYPYEQYKIPYEHSYLPAVKLMNPDADKTLIVFAGYDSYMEEMVKAMRYLKGIPYNIIVFDGPGQGTALRNGLKLIHNWEKPISTIIDYFKLDRVSMVGVSLGGYLVMRAAAFEKRVDKIVAFDIFYCFMDALRNRMPEDLMRKIEEMLGKEDKDGINQLFHHLMAKSLDLSWKLNKGMENTGTTNPYDLLKAFQKYSMANIGSLINQEVLLLAGQDDQYVPIVRLAQLKKELVNAANIKSVVFTKETGGEQHCQAGHRELAFNEIKKFLS